MDSPLEVSGFEPPVPRQIGSAFQAWLALLEGGVPARFPPAVYALLEAWQGRAPQASAPDPAVEQYLRPPRSSAQEASGSVVFSRDLRAAFQPARGFWCRVPNISSTQNTTEVGGVGSLVVGDQARLRCLGAGVAGSAACFRFRPPATGNNKVACRRSGAVLFAFLRAPSARLEADASCARLRFKVAIKSMMGGGAAISLGLTGSPFILASISSRKAS